MANLRHPNLPKVIDHFQVPDQGQYLVMEFIEGQDLQEMLDKTRDPRPEAQELPWIFQVCEALSYLHSRTPPIIHRDLKPANIRITPEGTTVLVDFGISKIHDPVKGTTLGARATTPGYAPFEQYSKKPTDARSDVYALLGAILYAVLTDKTPPESIASVGGKLLTPPIASILQSHLIPRALSCRQWNSYPRDGSRVCLSSKPLFLLLNQRQ